MRVREHDSCFTMHGISSAGIDVGPCCILRVNEPLRNLHKTLVNHDIPVQREIQGTRRTHESACRISIIDSV